MYILNPASVPTGLAVLSGAAASLARQLELKDAPKIWPLAPCRTVFCKVSDEESEKAKTFEDHLVLTEFATSGQEVAIVFKPREEWPEAFKSYQWVATVVQPDAAMHRPRVRRSGKLSI